MAKLRSIVMAVLSGLAAILAAAAYVLWKVRKPAEATFRAEIDAMKEVAFSDLRKPDEIAAATEKARIEATKRIESETKEEIRERFKARFQPRKP